MSILVAAVSRVIVADGYRQDLLQKFEIQNVCEDWDSDMRVQDK